jgi:hypothetical protein
MKSPGNVSLPKVHNPLISEWRDTKMAAMAKTEFKSLILKMISDLTVDLNEKLNEVWESI